MAALESIRRKLYRNLTIILFSVAAAVVLVITTYTSVLIDSFSLLIRNSIEERLLAAVRSAAAIATPAELAELRTPGDMKKPLYSELKMRLIKFGSENNLTFVYFYYMTDEGTFQPIVDNDLTEDAYTLKSEPLFPEPAVKLAVDKRTAVTTILGTYSEGFTGLLSAFAPLIDHLGLVRGVVGVDISDEELITTRARFRLLSIMLFVSMGFTITSGLSSFFVYKKNENLFTQRLKQQELMSSLTGSFISEKNIHDLINEALHIAGEFLGVQRMVVGLPGENRRIARPDYFWSSDGSVFVMPEIEGFNKFIRTSFPPEADGTAAPLVCNDVEEHPKYDFMKPAGVTAFILAPLYLDGKFWGIVGVEACKGPRYWTKSNQQLVSTVVSVIAGAAARNLREEERDAALGAAKKASQAKGDFLANMSHEMRTPLNAVIGMTAIAKASKDIEKKDYCLKKIEDASAHLLGVINDILDMSKIEADKFELSPVEFLFEKMLQKVVAVSSFRAGEKKQNFSVYIDKDIPPALVGDDQRLSQVIANLVSNAVKFTPEEGSVRLEARLYEEFGGKCMIKISVADSGIGITAEQKRRLFHSFEQADSGTSRKFGGTGLGLAISRRIVEMMGGRIWVDSKPGAGAVFSFTAVLQKGTEQKKSLLNPGINWKNLRILTVDDDRDILEYFTDLARRFGISCTTAASGEEALRLIRELGPFDIYFVDWKMPGMDGIELARRIKAVLWEAGSPSKSVITMISAAEWTVIEDEAKKAGVDKFISKPIFPSAIADCINQCIGQEEPKAQSPEAETADDFSGYKIILAEDIEINREIVISLLEPTRLAIDCACNGKEAVQLFGASPDSYGMIFMDVQMPEMDGYEATRQIRAFEKNREKSMGFGEGKTHGDGTERPRSPMPIIAMTANVFREDVEKCLEAGMNGHVGKPLDMTEVLVQLRKYLIRKPQLSVRNA
ncbi:MAG: response regulator [Treponema sp.]|nr:response regulator [Treponema sp.]